MCQNQLSIFAESQTNHRLSKQPLLMSEEFLIEWKSRIVNYQQQIWQNPSATQTSLFGIETAQPYDPEHIDPFNLHTRPFEFYRSKEDLEANCLYFVVDAAECLILYIGETQQCPRDRWMNHYCRDYTANYQWLNHHYNLKVAVNIGFCWDVPVDRRGRQAMELALIKKWKPPFNKENWKLYGQPFKKAGSKR
jgi:hypothetical protein